MAHDRSLCQRRKPPIPYTNGTCFTIRSHYPPPVTREMQTYLDLNEEAEAERNETEPLDRCVLHPPSAGSFGDSFADIQIESPIQVGDGYYSQLLAVKTVNGRCTRGAYSSGLSLVAKFYDPLYFDHKQDDVDPFICLDRAYAKEVAVYNKLADLQGNSIPDFHGSFSLDLPVPEHKTTRAEQATRSVRLILIERIPGDPLESLNAQQFSQSERQRVMKLVLDVDADMFARGIVHRDSKPRNILIVNQAATGKIERVVLVDFADCLFGFGESRLRGPGMYTSPLLRWHCIFGPKNRFPYWIDWDWQPWLIEQYAKNGALYYTSYEGFLSSR